MALTIASTETMLIRRIGKLMVLVGMDATTANGLNPDLAQPISAAISAMGQVVEDFAHPVDADLAAINAVPIAIPIFLKYAELETLKSAYVMSIDVDRRIETVDIKKSQLSSAIWQLIKNLEDMIAATPDPFVIGGAGIRVGQLTAGTEGIWPDCGPGIGWWP